ncbi:MAG TPA: hypothetical protein VK633_11825 [Verrucomicrobiae bacterium]|nr:hypothetical protein [Verrucomicrobiae bacterium]
MANVDNARGLHPIRGSNGGEPRMRVYKANVTTDIFQGDVVEMLATGTVKSIVTTTGSATAIGVAANRVDASIQATSQDVLVYDDPDQEFEVQDDGEAATPSQAVVGATFALILTTGNTTTGMSKHEIDASAAGVSATDAVLVQGFKLGPSFSIGKYATHIVRLNQHLYRTGSAGI